MKKRDKQEWLGWILFWLWVVLIAWGLDDADAAEYDVTPWLATAAGMSLLQDTLNKTEVSDVTYGLAGATVLSKLDIAKKPEFWVVSTSTLALLSDWLTTRDMSKRYDEGYYETNPRLGTHPSTRRIDEHFTGLSILHLGGNYLLQKIPDKKWRDILVWAENGFVIGSHGRAGYNNWKIGLHFKF